MRRRLRQNATNVSEIRYLYPMSNITALALALAEVGYCISDVGYRYQTSDIGTRMSDIGYPDVGYRYPDVGYIYRTSDIDFGNIGGILY